MTYVNQKASEKAGLPGSNRVPEKPWELINSGCPLSWACSHVDALSSARVGGGGGGRGGGDREVPTEFDEQRQNISVAGQGSKNWTPRDILLIFWCKAAA